MVNIRLNYFLCQIQLVQLCFVMLTSSYRTCIKWSHCQNYNTPQTPMQCAHITFDENNKYIIQLLIIRRSGIYLNINWRLSHTLVCSNELANIQIYLDYYYSYSFHKCHLPAIDVHDNFQFVCGKTSLFIFALIFPVAVRVLMLRKICQ